MPIIGCILWVVVGVILAVPYNWAAGASLTDGIGTILLLPPALFALAIAWMISRTDKRFHVLFAILAAYVFLPVFLNQVSHLIRFFGCVPVADFFYEYRFKSLAAVPFALIVMLLVTSSAPAAVDKIKKRRNILIA